MNLTDFGFIMRNRIAYGINAVSQRLIEKLQDEKLDKITVEATTSVMDYLVSPYTMLSALPFGDSSLRLGDGSIFIHKDQMIESTMMVIYQNGLKTYTLAVDENTAEVTSITDQGSWMLSQVGLSVNDIYNPSYWVGTNTSLKSSLNAKADKEWTYVGYAYAGSKVTVNQSFSEAMVVVAGNYNNSYRVMAEGIFVPRMWEEQINNTMVMSLGGYHLTDSDHGYIAVTVTNGGKSFECRSLTWGNQNLNNKYVMVFIR